VVVAQLGQELRLRCHILGRHNTTAVSWTKQTRTDPANPIALTYNNMVRLSFHIENKVAALKKKLADKNVLYPIRLVKSYKLYRTPMYKKSLICAILRRKIRIVKS
jgi:hypothetical protein